VLVKRECFEKVGLFDERLPTCEDWDMWLRIAEFYECDFVNEKLVALRRHEKNMSKGNRDMIRGRVMVYNKLAGRNKIPPDILSSIRYEMFKRYLHNWNDINYLRGLNDCFSVELRKQLDYSVFGFFFLLSVGVVRLIKKLMKKVFNNGDLGRGTEP